MAVTYNHGKVGKYPLRRKSPSLHGRICYGFDKNAIRRDRRSRVFGVRICFLQFAIFDLHSSRSFCSCHPSLWRPRRPLRRKRPRRGIGRKRPPSFGSNPNDVYLQYVALQLARNEGKGEEVQGLIDRLTQRRFGFLQPQDREVDLFSLFSGALAVQESLQLDAMRGQANPRLGRMSDPTKNTVKIAALEGPSVKSHPWDKMLAAQLVSGKQPEIGPLDLCVPEDQYYLHFRTLSKLLDMHRRRRPLGNASLRPGG